MKKFIRFLNIIFALMLVAASSVPAFADDNASYVPYFFTAYNVDINVNENNSFDITEHISTYFNEQRHGIFRTIPTRNQVKRTDGTSHSVKAKIKNIKASENCDVSIENGNYVLQIGDADTYVEGEHDYTIKYTYMLGEDQNNGFDELYYNIIGDGWDTYIQNITFKITMPKEFDKSKLGFSIGNYGTVGTYDINYDVNDNIITGSVARTLQPNEAVTVRLELEDGYFYFNKTLYNFKLALLVAVPALLFIIVIILWSKFGKDKKAVQTVEFYPPNGMSSADIAFWQSGLIANNEKLTPLLIELANDGYIQIEEVETKSKKKSEFAITKLKDRYDENDRAKEIFFNGLFKNGTRNKIYKSDLEDDFYLTLNIIRELYNKPEKRHKVFEAKSLYMRILAWVLCALSVFAVLFNFSNLFDSNLKYILTLVGIIICIISFVFSFFIRKRTDEAVDILGKINGFKNFLETAEKDKLEALVDDDPAYFYNILPYAYVLGVSDKWMKKFESIAVEPPQWYYGYYPYNYIMFSHFMRDTINSASNAMVSMPVQSGSGGSFSSGSGGFAGGGTGGGGGGSW
ncbi:MAG: DUF2207 domain-containing protein [Eubacteriales bacterium]|nr:DUF2207 domain-containing protein [Eubacteriales bacterium]